MAKRSVEFFFFFFPLARRFLFLIPPPLFSMGVGIRLQLFCHFSPLFSFRPRFGTARHVN